MKAQSCNIVYQSLFSTMPTKVNTLYTVTVKGTDIEEGYLVCHELNYSAILTELWRKMGAQLIPHSALSKPNAVPVNKLVAKRVSPNNTFPLRYSVGTQTPDGWVLSGQWQERCTVQVDVWKSQGALHTELSQQLELKRLQSLLSPSQLAVWKAK